MLFEAVDKKGWSRSQLHMPISMALINPIPVSSHQCGCYSLVPLLEYRAVMIEKQELVKSIEAAEQS